MAVGKKKLGVPPVVMWLGILCPPVLKWGGAVAPLAYPVPKITAFYIISCSTFGIWRILMTSYSDQVFLKLQCFSYYSHFCSCPCLAALKYMSKTGQIFVNFSENLNFTTTLCNIFHVTYSILLVQTKWLRTVEMWKFIYIIDFCNNQNTAICHQIITILWRWVLRLMLRLMTFKLS